MKNAVVQCIKEGRRGDYEPPEKYELSMNQKKWCELLDDLLSSVKEHKKNSFESISVIDTQEIINVQLLQEDHELYNNEKKLGYFKAHQFKRMKKKNTRLYMRYQ